MIIEINSSNAPSLDWAAKGTERIIQNINNILHTYKYEVAYNRDLGISPDLIDKDVETMKSIIAEDLFDNIQKNEPRAKLKSVTVTEVTADGEIIAELKIEI
jgi:phage baseplate assembly protein W